MNCIFCQIAAKKEKSYIIYENDEFLSFLDFRPVFHGHALLVPKKHIETFYDLPKELVEPFFTLSQKLGKAVEKGMNAQGSFVAMNNIVSQSVPHLHIHLVPRVKGDGLRGFFWPRQKYESEIEIEATRKRIADYIS